MYNFVSTLTRDNVKGSMPVKVGVASNESYFSLYRKKYPTESFLQTDNSSSKSSGEYINKKKRQSVSKFRNNNVTLFGKEDKNYLRNRKNLMRNSYNTIQQND